MSDAYAIYLRKSRKDLEAEAMGQTDTLLRHRTALLDLAGSMHLTITDIYAEVVSGESIAARPEMQKLLSAVEQGVYAGVLVMEVERLARGDTIDQGIVAQTFKYSSTKIVTPVKVYDPEDEFDEEYFEFGLFMSRREYKTINRRLQRGREASMREGKYVANKTPYGYGREKLAHEKGYILVPILEQAEIVHSIFDWFTGTHGPRIGVSRIVRRLNEMGIPSPMGHDWTNCVVRSILSNPTYAGWLRWGSRAGVKRVVDGAVVTSHPRADDNAVKLFRGRHEPVISQEMFDLAKDCLARNHSRPGARQAETANPLAGLIVCGQCGRRMVRRPYGRDKEAGIICPYTSCRTVGSDLSVVESAILDGLRIWLGSFELGPPNAEDSGADRRLAERSVAFLKKELQQLALREAKACELAETGAYSPDIFQQRMNSIRERRAELANKLDAQKRVLQNPEKCGQELLPKVRFVLDAYELAATAAEKNELLKSLLSKVVYRKSRRERWAGGSDLSLTLYPVLPSRSESLLPLTDNPAVRKSWDTSK